METTPVVCISLPAMLLLAMTSAARDPAGVLVETVRQATEQFQNVEEAHAGRLRRRPRVRQRTGGGCHGGPLGHWVLWRGPS